MTTNFVTLFKNFVAGMTDYMAKHNANYATIEDKLNYILSMLTGQSGGDLSVPVGLQEIFDRAGIIGIGSYDFSEGALAGPGYNLGVNSGGLLVRHHLPAQDDFGISVHVRAGHRHLVHLPGRLRGSGPE